MKKNPWVAAILNLFFSGGGYIYIGKRVTFGWLMLASTILYYIWSFSDPLSEKVNSSPLFLIASVIASIAFAIDAYSETK